MSDKGAHLVFFTLYLNQMFFYLDTQIDCDLEKGIHAFVDDILFLAASLCDIQEAFEAFAGPA